MPQGVGRDTLGDLRGTCRFVDGLLQHRLVQVVPASLTRPLIRVAPCRREQPLPRPFPPGIRVLPIQGIGQRHPPRTLGQVVLVQPTHVLQMLAQRLHKAPRQRGDAVFATLTIAHPDLFALEVDILDAKAHALLQAQPGAVEQAGHEPRGALELFEHGSNLAHAQHDRQPLGTLGAHRLPIDRPGLAQHVVIQKQQRSQRLVLGRRAHAARDGEMLEIGVDGLWTELLRMAAIVEQNESANPGAVRLLGACAVVTQAHGAADAVEQPGGVVGHSSR